MTGLIVDLFAGAGGASVGIEAALGRPVDIAVNHNPVALAVHRANHPATRHLVSDVWEVDPVEATGGRAVDVGWFSPDCRHFSSAKGDVPRSPRVRSLAWVVVRWAKAVRPRCIFLENVPEFQGWGPLDSTGRPDKARKGLTFLRWRKQLERLGYVVDHRVLDSSLYGAPTKRRRLFLVARCDGEQIRWPEPTHGPGLLPLHTAAECIDWSLPCPSIFGRSKPLAEKTLWRIAQGIRRFVLATPRPFIIGTGKRSGGDSRALVAAFIARHFGGPRPVLGSHLESPLHTITAWDHHSLAAVCLAKFRGTDPSQPGSCPVTDPLPTISAGGIHVAEVRAFLSAHGAAPSGASIVTIGDCDYQIIDIGMRMLSPSELLRAQFGRFAGRYDISDARTKTNQIRLIGNSVVPAVAEALVRANTRPAEERAA